jgi:glycosyltransferase involved in cell wall biosynthesis
VSAARPTFSVVMPAFNTEDTVGDAVESVLSQADQDFELVVVDDGSTDGTAAVLAGIEDARVRVLTQENRGAAAARNTAIRASTGRLVSFIDSDDLWMPTYLAAMRERFDASPDVALAYTDSWFIDPVSGRVGTATAMQWQRPPVPPPANPDRLLLELLERNFIYAAATIRRDVLDDVGLLDERLRAAVDYELWLRVVARRYPVARLDGLHAIYRKGRVGSISANRARVWQSLADVYRTVAEEYDVDAGARAKARSRLAAARRELDALEGRGGIAGRSWRRLLRPALIQARNALFRRGGWRDVPPREVVDAFPTLVAVRVGRR